MPVKKICVGLPVFNGENFLAPAIESILSQTFSDFDFIIADNASTDSTESICRHYADKDSRIRYYRNKSNIGVFKNFNLVYSLSNCEFFKWACSDDQCKPTLLSTCIDVLDADPSIILTYAKAGFIDENNKALGKEDPGWDLQSEDPVKRGEYVISSYHYINSFYGLIRSSVLNQTDLFPVFPGGDIVLLYQMSLIGRFYEIPEILYSRRLHSASSVNNVNNKDFFPDMKKSSSLSRYKYFYKHTLNSKIKYKNKIRLLIMLAKKIRWDRENIMNDIKSRFSS